MSSVPISSNNEISGLAERRAADVSSGRQQLGSGRETLDRYRANELAEAEALSLARIKADTQRALAHQAQALHDAERAAELIAIKRRSADLDAIKETQRRQALDHEAANAASAHAEANRLAEQTALDKKSALMDAHDVRQTRLKAEQEALHAHRNNRRACISLAWVALRSASPLTVGFVALILGTGSSWLLARVGSNTEIATQITALATAKITATAEAPLRLDTELSAPLTHQ